MAYTTQYNFQIQGGKQMRYLTGKRADGFKQQYLTTTATHLRDLYKSYSWEKGRAFVSIGAEMESVSGFGLRVWGANCFYYSCGYRFYDKQGNEILKVFTGRGVHYVQM